ncbi:DUF2732 family protein [Providencia huaxiensis]|uniref:DUF2732 family protein n=2 Tax=Providencia huaxiensis TaxID=2027290 RepID=A0A8I2DBE8_9GAMM|nr:DUF2732 family protein [Providencia huaxiensis]
MTLIGQGFLHSKFEVSVMKNIEKRKIIIKGRSVGKSTELPLIAFGNPTKERNDFTIAISINAIREDERKTMYDKFSSRLDAIACKIINEKLNDEQIHQLLVGESEHYSNLAAELNHV